MVVHEEEVVIRNTACSECYGNRDDLVLADILVVIDRGSEGYVGNIVRKREFIDHVDRSIIGFRNLIDGYGGIDPPDLPFAQIGVKDTVYEVSVVLH